MSSRPSAQPPKAIANRYSGRTRRWSKSVVFAACAVALAACGDEPTPFEVIDEITFDASLGIDLAQYTELPSGVYVLDVTTGTGDVVDPGPVTVGHTGWLASGLEFSTGTFSFVYPSGVISGFGLGMEGMLEGGVRRIIIPPELGYGANPPQNSPIPEGAVLIFEVTLVVVG